MTASSEPVPLQQSSTTTPIATAAVDSQQQQQNSKKNHHQHGQRQQQQQQQHQQQQSGKHSNSTSHSDNVELHGGPLTTASPADATTDALHAPPPQPIAQHQNQQKPSFPFPFSSPSSSAASSATTTGTGTTKPPAAPGRPSRNLDLVAVTDQQSYLPSSSSSYTTSTSTPTSSSANKLLKSNKHSKAHSTSASSSHPHKSSLLSGLAVRTKNSASSLVYRSNPSHHASTHSLHSKTASSGTASTTNSSRSDNYSNLSSLSSGDTHSPSSSVSHSPSHSTLEIDRTAAAYTAAVDPSRSSVDLRQSLSSSRKPSSDHSPASTVRRAGGSDNAGGSNPHNKMHQTSSRLLRMTDEERPFTRDFKDLFSTLMVSLPLSPHRVRFQKIDHTFTSEEAINNLGSLKFSQSNRMPDPKDPSRIVTTTTTTTFSMAKEMARSVCQRFMDARFIESADGKTMGIFPLKGALWQLTPKGMHVLGRFCQRNGINQRHVLDLLESSRNSMHLVILERDPGSDKMSHDRATVEVIFRRFVGQDGPNIKSNTAISDNDSVSEYYNGLVGVKMAKERKVVDRIIPNTFTGKAAVDWLMDCTTTVDRRETFEIAELFVQHGLIYAALEDKVFARQNLAASRFQPTKDAIFALTEKGQRVAGWIKTPAPAIEPAPSSGTVQHAPNRSEGGRSGPRDSNNNRLLVIVNDPALRLLFREYLRETHCEENMAFFLEVREFTKQYDISERAKAFTRLDAIRESLAAAYGLYNAFLAPGSPCELNIDHNLRNSLAGRMTRAVGDDDSMLKSLQDVVALFKEAQTSVFKLMSSDSVPKFLKEPKYAAMLKEHNFDTATPVSNHTPSSSTLPERTLSRVQRDNRG